MNKFILKVAVVVLILMVGCSKKDDPSPDPKPTPNPEVTLKNPINDFVWKAMNSWYKWQADVPNLADTKDDNKNNYYTYLNNYSKPEDLFESLRYKKGEVDRFSWFIEDYIEQEKAFQGVYVTTGIRRSVPIATENDKVIIYAQHVTKGSPADVAGIKRGDIIYAIDGIEANTTNYRDVINKLYSGKTIVVSTANVGKNDILSKKADFTITPAEVSDDPIYLTKVFENINGKKVGYLVYNGFRSSYNKALNDAFVELKNANIDELILDFRINGGGSVLTCGYLASMIYGEGGENNIFAKAVYNAKHPKNGFTLPFLSGIYQYDDAGNYLEGQDIPLNRLTGLSKLYVITSNSTASASEMIINGLKPYLPTLKTVGETTYGKNVGSITLYDSPSSGYSSKKGINTKHKNAMQPITFQIYNKLNQSDYTKGFTPDIKVEEYKSWRNILPLGDENETLLKTVLNDIRGVSARPNSRAIENSKAMSTNGINQELKFETEMYFDSNFMNNLSK